MVGILLTELSMEESNKIRDFFKKNPNRKECVIEVEGKVYNIPKEIAEKGNRIRLMGDISAQR